MVFFISNKARVGLEDEIAGWLESIEDEVPDSFMLSDHLAETMAAAAIDVLNAIIRDQEALRQSGNYREWDKVDKS